MTLLPRWYFSGLIIGLALLSISGALLKPYRFAVNFNRYHQAISSETGLVPTPREIETILQLRMTGSPIFVIVGGSSILHGVGQQPNEAWSRYLQDQLGDRYKVINLALRAGRGNECGVIAVEMLLQRQLPVIYIADGIQPVSSERPSRFARCIYHAWAHGYLLPWPLREERLRWDWLRSRDFLQHNISGTLDAVLNFENVWHYISFEQVSLVWSPMLGKKSFAPKVTIPDYEQPITFYEDYRVKRPHFQAQIETARSVGSRSLADMIENRVPSTDGAEVGFPPRVRAVTLAVFQNFDPAFAARLPADQQAAVAQRHDKYAAKLIDIGFGDVLISTKGYVSDDYADLLHLLPTGGRKLANEAAPSVRDMARRLGYTHE